ncbi:MAG: DNA-binding response regulator [Comamonadaceae bacterium]|jgi:DNA-binding NarL/FixJ family response regulator|nr:response regulator transcription factor [Rhodoferax sp.]TSA11985.1 MAG: DNA-binding response regulator [Comamonadaceae bacterium]
MLKILVVDDHALVREGLRQVLKGLDEQLEVLEAGQCSRAFELAALHPDLDLVLLDYGLPDMNGLEALTLFGQQHPELPVVMISGMVEPRIVRQVMALGAVGFIAKASLSSELLTILRAVLEGQIYMPPEFLAGHTALDEVDAPDGPQLTSRQHEVLGLMLAARSNKEISGTLNLSDETVKNHVSAVLRAFGVQTRMQAVLAATLRGYSKAQTP